jgi:hypothetical protein
LPPEEEEEEELYLEDRDVLARTHALKNTQTHIEADSSKYTHTHML